MKPFRNEAEKFYHPEPDDASPVAFSHSNGGSASRSEKSECQL